MKTSEPTLNVKSISKMEFTYDAYTGLIQLLNKHDFTICGYHNHSDYEKCAILRHDIDCCLEEALNFARLENKLNVISTYFILLSSDFYNIASKKVQV